MKLAILLNPLLHAAVAFPATVEQEPLISQPTPASFDLIYEQALRHKAEIIPTVIDSFKPLLTVNITWSSDVTAEYGNTVNPVETQDMPGVQFIDTLPNSPCYSEFMKMPQLTLAMTDPDAPSRDNPEWSEICHWIATDVPLDFEGCKSGVKSKVKEIMPYKPPGPPPETGKHRYVFVALAPVNGTTEKLHLQKPGDRQHWGFEKERQGLRIWAEEMGLQVVGANFIYEQNDDQ